MRMVSLRIAGFRRFERETTLDLTPRVLAVVGPNEAGKSSLLDAMEYLPTPPEDGFKDRDFGEVLVGMSITFACTRHIRTRFG